VQRKKSYIAIVSIITIGVAIATAGTMTRTAIGVLPSSSATTSKSNQTTNVDVSTTIQHTKDQQSYNATENMILSFKTADSLLIQALNNLNAGKTSEALTQLNSAKVQIEQYQLAALDAMSNPVLQISREHLLAAQQALNMGNTDQAISELNMLRQLRILHQQGMMVMKLPMAGEMNSTFNSLESHLLVADENINGYNIRGAISELNLANDQLYAHQLAMLDIVYSFLNNTRTHLKQSISDINSANVQGAISQLKMVNQLLRANEQGMLMIIGKKVQPSSNLL
jgi:hypothetical protein